MPTKPVLPITELDFFRAKNQLKDFLRNDPSGRFNDIDFEGSNMSVLLDVLAYNTYQNNFYTNMAISEMFLDSAQLENSIVSHAKELNYLPRSAKSAVSLVNVSIRDIQNQSATVEIPKNTRFVTSQSGERFNFFTAQSYSARRVGDNYVAEMVEIFEGELVEEIFIFNGGKINIINSNADVTSIKIFEVSADSLQEIEYTFRNDIFGIASDDAVFYIEPSFDGTYDIVFGNDRFGRNPNQGARLRVEYIVSSGSAANGACNFTTSFVQNASVLSVNSASGGDEKETLEDIKFFAPRSIQVQERAVTERDYEVLLKQRFNEIQDVSVFGGEELDPPQFGKVAVAVNVQGGLSDTSARTFETFLRDKTPVAIQPIFLPPEFLYVNLDINITFNPKQTSQSKDSIETEIRELLRQYAINNLNKFGAVLEISKISTLIDASNTSIVNNTIDALPYILYAPDFNRKENPTFAFGSSLESPCRFSRANKAESYNSFVRSSIFRFEETNAIFEDNGLGSINIINARDRGIGEIEIIRRNAGTVNYETGTVKLSDFVVESYDAPGIRITANTQEKNVTAPKRKVLLLRDRDININIIEARIK